MPKLVLRKRWASQPQGPVLLDGGNPLARDLILSLSLSPGTGYKSLGRDGRTGTPTAVTSTATPQGTAASFAGSGFIDLGTAAVINGATPFTLALYETVAATSAFSALVGFVSTDGQQWLWLRGSDSAYTCALGRANNGGSQNFNSLGTPVVGEKIRFVVTNSNGMGGIAGIRLWANGIEQTSTALTNFGAVAASSSYIGWDSADTKWQGSIQDVNLWGRVLTDGEIASYFASPYQLFAPQSRSIWVPAAAGGGVTHATTGALVANAATVSGTAAHLKLHTSTGALTGQGAAIAGVAAHLGLHTTTGALVATAATVAGAASRLVAHPSTGALVASASAISGAAAHVTVHGATGALVATAATVAGTAAHLKLHTSTGALAASAAAVAGAAARSTAGTHPTSGALTGQSANIAGTAAHVVVHATTGSLAGQSANIMGTAAHLMLHAASGALAAQSANITGAASRPSIHSSIAAMIAQSAIIVGGANRLAFGASTIGRPVSDTSTTGWVASSGGALYAMVNEAIPDASTYVYTTTLGQMCEMALNAMQYPGSAAQVLMFRGSSQSGNSVIVRLINTSGATVRVIEQALTPVDTQYSATLSAGEVAAITSGALSIQLESA